MPIRNGLGLRGAIKISGIITTLFLVTTLATGVIIVNYGGTQQIGSRAYLDENTSPAPSPSSTTPENPPAAGGYSYDTVVNTVAETGRPGYDCSKGGCAPGTEVAGYYKADNGKYYPVGGTGNDPSTYAATSLEAVKQQAAADAAAQNAADSADTATGTVPENKALRDECRFEGGTMRDGQCQITSTTTFLEKTDEGFITHTTTIVKDINCNVITAKTVDTTKQTTSTFTETADGLVRTDTVVTTDLAGNIISTQTLAPVLVQPTSKASINQQGIVSIKKGAGSSCQVNSECDSGSCVSHGGRGGVVRTCGASPEIAQAPVDTKTQVFNILNTITFGGFEAYVKSYAPGTVVPSWQGAGYKSLKDCWEDMIAKYHNPEAPKGCNTYTPSKEKIVSSTRLGTTLTAEGAAVFYALPAAITAGTTAAATGGTALTVATATGTNALASLGAITTLNQTSNAAVAHIEDPGSTEAWK